MRSACWVWEGGGVLHICWQKAAPMCWFYALLLPSSLLPHLLLHKGPHPAHDIQLVLSRAVQYLAIHDNGALLGLLGSCNRLHTHHTLPAGDMGRAG